MTFFVDAPLIEGLVRQRADRKIQCGVLKGKTVRVTHQDREVDIDSEVLAKHLCDTYISPENKTDHHYEIAKAAIEAHLPATPPETPPSLEDFISAVMMRLANKGIQDHLQQRSEEKERYEGILTRIPTTTMPTEEIPLRKFVTPIEGEKTERVARGKIPKGSARRPFKTFSAAVAKRKRVPETIESMISSALEDTVVEKDPLTRGLILSKLGAVVNIEANKRPSTVNQEAVHALVTQYYQKISWEVKALVQQLKQIEKNQEFVSGSLVDKLSQETKALEALATNPSLWSSTPPEQMTAAISEAHTRMLESQSIEVSRLLNQFLRRKTQEEGEKAISALEALYGNKQEFLLFVRDLKKLHARPGIINLPFIEKLSSMVLLGGQVSISPFKALSITGQLLFLIDKGIPLSDLISDDFEVTQKKIEEKVVALVSTEKEKYDELINNLKETPFYKKQLFENVQLPKAVAELLVLQDGTINLGIISIVKKIFLSADTSKRRTNEIFLSTVLLQVRSDQELVQVVERKLFSEEGGQSDLSNLILERPTTTRVTNRDAHVACLASLLTWSRQGTVSDCFITAPYIFLSERGRRWLAEDFNELVTNGTLTRDLEGQVVSAQGLLWPLLSVTNVYRGKGIPDFGSREKLKSLFSEVELYVDLYSSCESLKKFSKYFGINTKENWIVFVHQIKKESFPIKSVQELKKLLEDYAKTVLKRSLPQEKGEQIETFSKIEDRLSTIQKSAEDASFTYHIVQRACQELGIITQAQWDEAVDKMRLPLSTFRELFEQLSTDPEKTQKALFQIEASVQPTMITVWKNAMATMRCESEKQTYVNAILNGLKSSFKAKKRRIADVPNKTKITETILPLIHPHIIPQHSSDPSEMSRIMMVKKDGKLVPISEKDFVAFVGDKLGIEDLDVKAFISGFKKEILPRGTPRAQGKESLHSDPICDVMAFLGDIVPTTEYTAIYERKLETMKLTPVTTKGGRDGLIEFLTWAQGMSKDQPRTAALRGLSASADHAFTVTPNHPSVAFFSERTKKRITAQETESISFARMSQSPGEWKIWLDRNIFVGRAASFRRNEITLSKDCTIEEVIEEVLKKLPVEPDAKAIEKENTKRVLLLKCIRKHLLEKTGYCPIITFGDSNWITDTEMPIYFGYIFDPWLQKWGCIDIYGDEDTLRISSKDELEKIHVEIKSISWGAHELERIHLLSFDRTSSKHLQNLEDAFTAAWNSLGSFIATLSDADREQFLTFIRKPTEELLRESGCDISKKFVPKTPENWKEAFLQCIELQYRHRKIIEEVCSSPGEYRVSRVQDQYLHYLNNEMAFLEQVKNLLSGKMMDMAISPPPSPLTTPETPSPVVTPLPLSPTLEERVSPGPAEELGEPELKKPTKPSITEEKEAQAQQRADAEKTARSAAEGAPLYAEMPLATKALEAEGRALKAQAEAEATATDAQTAVVQRLEREAQARAEEIHKTVQAVATANAEAATKMLKLANTAELTAVTATNVAKEAEAMQKAEMNVLVRAPLLTGMAKKLRENAQKASNTKQEADTTLEQAKATALKARAEITSSLTRAQQFAKDARQAADKAQAPEAMRLAQLAEEASVRAEEEAGQAYKAISQFIQEAQTQAEQVAKARTEAVKAAQVTLAAKIAAVKAAEETAALSQAAESASAAQAKKAIETSVAAATQELKAAQDAALQAADAVIRAEQAVTSAQKVVFSVRRQAVATTTAFKSQKLDNEKFRTVGRNAWERVLQIQKQTEERFREISTAAGGAKAAKAEAEQWSQTAEEAVSEARKAEKPEQAVEALKKAQQATLHAQEAQSTAMQNAKSASENATMLTNEPDKAAKAENVLAAAQAYQTEVGKVLESWSNPPYIVNFSALNTCAQRVEEMIGVLNALPLKEKIQTSGMIQESHKLERALKTCNVLKRYQELKTIFDLFGGWAGNRTKAMWIDATTNELTCGPLTLFVPTHSPDGIGDAVDETLGPLLKDVEWMDKLTDGLKKGIKENLMYLKEMYPSDERIQQVTYDLINALDQALERSTRGAASEVGEQEKEGLGERAAKRKKS